MPVNDALEPIAALWDCVGEAVVEVVLLFDADSGVALPR